MCVCIYISTVLMVFNEDVRNYQRQPKPHKLKMDVEMSAPICNDAFLQSFGQWYRKRGYSVYFYIAQPVQFDQ